MEARKRMATFEPMRVSFTPIYFLMLVATITMCLAGFALGSYVWKKLEDLAPHRVEGGDSW
jgi:hypothetical protein